jgi:serine/threonine-protein kinase
MLGAQSGQVPGTRLMPQEPAGRWGATGAGTAQPISPSAQAQYADDIDPSRKRRLAVMWSLISAGIVAVIVVIVLILNSGNGTPTVTQVEVPVIPPGSNVDQARAIIEGRDLGFRDAIDPTPSTLAAGIFTRSDPEAGVLVDPGTEILVYFSAGPKSVGVPDLTNMTLEEAEDELARFDLERGNVESEPTSERIGKDHVTRTVPPTGQAIQAGQSVDIFLSDGTVEVPDLKDKTREEALALISELPIRYQFVDVPTQGVEPGLIVSQDPAAGRVDHNTSVTINIATVFQLPVPNLVGQPLSTALAICGTQLVCVQAEFANSDTVPAGSVISTNPPVGTMVDEGSTVNLTISQGVPTTTVPGNLVGMTQAEAAAALAEAKLTLGTVTSEYNPTIPAGRVISSTPFGNQTVQEGTPVNLVVSLGPEPSPDPEDTGP